jgi:Arc/MetJ-type ribon-helix-helix transcriptional regulator
MTNGAEPSLKQIELKLNFIRRAVAGMMTEDYETQDEVIKAALSALRAVEEIKLDAQPEGEDEFTVPAPREQDAAPLIGRKVEMVRGFVI